MTVETPTPGAVRDRAPVTRDDTGGGWLTFLWPPLARTIWPVLFGLGGLAELGLVAWLLVKGVNTQAREAPAQ